MSLRTVIFQHRLDDDAVCILGAADALVPQAFFLHVEENVGVEVLAVDACFEVQVLGSGSSCASCQSDSLPGLYRVAALHQVFGVVAVDGLQAGGMAYHNDITVGAVGFRHAYHTGEGTADGVVGLRLDVDTCMPSAAPSIGRDNFAVGQGETIVIFSKTVEVQQDGFTLVEQSRCSHSDVVHLHVGEGACLLLALYL